MPSRKVGARLVTALVASVCLWLAGATEAFAGDFAGLTPGRSTRADADRVLGRPILEVETGRRYDYDPGRFDATRLSIAFGQGGGIIESIDIFPTGRFVKTDIEQFLGLGLGQPEGREVTERGALIELYATSSMALHYRGGDPSSGIAALSHVAPKVLEEMLAALRERSDPRPYLGLKVEPHEGQGILVAGVLDSGPADRGGLQAGDVILELGPYEFYGVSIDPARFRDQVERLPTGEALLCLVKRGQRKHAVSIVLEGVVPDQQRRRHGELARDHYREAERALERRDCDTAISHLESAVLLNPRDSVSLQLLGYCQYRKRRYPEAEKAFTRALATDPASAYSTFYLAVIHDLGDDGARAAELYDKYLGMSDVDERRREHAGKRIRRLRCEAAGDCPEDPWAEFFGGFFDAVIDDALQRAAGKEP